MDGCERPVEVPARNLIIHCKVHQEQEIIGFCNDCKTLFCKECVRDHIEHKMQKLESFCEEKKKSVLKQISVKELSTQLEEKRNKMIKRRENLDIDQNSVKREINFKKRIIGENREDSFSQEIERMDAATRYLMGLEENASTVTLKNACVKATELFDLKDKIREEFLTLENSLADARRKIVEINRDIKKLNEEISVLNYFRGENGKYEFDEGKWTTFLLLNENTTLFIPPKHYIKTVVDKFKAFPSVKEVFDIEEMMGRNLINVGQRVKMTESLNVEKSLVTGSDIYASISHRGILAICANRSIIQFTDLNNGRQVWTRVENWTLIGFYNAMVLLLTYGMSLREAPVEKVFDNLTIDIFQNISGTKHAYPCTDVSLLNERRILYYPTITNRLFSFNVDTRVNTKIKIRIGKNIDSIASFTGIDCGVQAVFYGRDTNTYTLNKDGTITKIRGGQNNWISAIFPSASNPNNIADTVFKYGCVLIKGRNRIDTTNLIELGGHHSVVRIYKDIFLAYNGNANEWALVRMVTP